MPNLLLLIRLRYPLKIIIYIDSKMTEYESPKRDKFIKQLTLKIFGCY